MSDSILASKLTIYYLDENRRKQIRWTGTSDKNDIEKMIDVYDGSEELMTLPVQQNKGLIFSAETPGEYTIGKIDAGEIDPWFIDLKTMEHIVGDYQNFTGCALKTSGWKRVQDSNSGIVVVSVTAGGAIVTGDIGLDVVHADADIGTLLDVVVTGGAIDYLFIRPDSNVAANNFDSVSGNLTCNAHISVQTSASVTGEMVWGNAYTQGALVNDAHVFIFQNGERVTSSDATNQDFWVDGHIDRNLPITDYTADNFPIIDDGYLIVKANQYGSKHTYATIRMNSKSGGNVSAGLSSGDDINNTTGYKSIDFTAVAGNWTVGDEINGDVSGARAIITQIDSPGAAQKVHYFLIGDPLIDFNTAIETLSNADDTGTGTKNASSPADQGPALPSWFDGSVAPTYSFGATQADINDDGTNEEYSINIIMSSSSLAQMHEHNKYTHMRGSIADQDNLDGQEWIGLDYAISYATITGTVAEGVTVIGVISGATGIVVSNPGGSSNIALLRNSRGTFIDGEDIQIDAGNKFDATGLTVEVIVPVAESSFGTLAGTTFFATRGVLLTGYKASEENSFSLIDAAGTPRARPTSITMEILNLKQHDWASAYRLISSGGVINKDEYSAVGGETAGAVTLTVDGAIAADVPGKSLGGHVILQDVSDNGKEYVLRYDSYVAATGIITLSSSSIVAVDSGTTTNITEAGAFVNTKVGDLAYNLTQGEVSYVKTITDDNNIIVDPPFSAATTGDNIELNTIPVALIDTLDKVYLAIIFEFKIADGSASASMQYIADIFARVVVRNTSDAVTKIKGYTSEVTIGTGGGIASATRIENTVYGS